MVRTMTTLKPQLVRADTLDLQDHDAPSAKDHTRQPAHPAPYGYGPAAPHQAQTLRHAEEDAYQQQSTSPRISEEHSRGAPYSADQRFYDDPDDDVDDEHMNHLHGPNGTQNHDHDYEDAEASDSHDEDMDDDMMDKISSSPSIEDGKYSLPRWPPVSDPVDDGASPAPFSTPARDDSPSSSPFISPPVYFPVPLPKEVDFLSKSRLGEDPCKNYFVSPAGDATGYQHFDHDDLNLPGKEHTIGGIETQEVANYLLPSNDPFLVDAFNDADEGFCDEEDAWEDEDVNMPDYNSSSDDNCREFVFTNDFRFIDSGWGGECLRDIEDIDFEFVYALHTFVATVEGQANATKGDTMVLLDDSNSYWWLVRVVKDGSIGYLPAEHIETPTERLARLNKHRNIDLSASMLGDNPEKTKNPLKKAMRRRNAKTVQFAPPTYYEPSEYEYSDEEDADDSQLQPNENSAKSEEAEVAQQQQADNTNTSTQEPRSATIANGIQRTASNESLLEERQSSPTKPVAGEPQQASISHQDSVSRPRKVVVRNTDSFFKDDSVETKKISLTPRLLRGDSESTASSEHEVRQKPSEETFEKLLANNEEKEKPKEQPKKEKKGMLSGLFKRKDKPPKSQPPADRVDKVSEESMRHSPQSKDSLESLTKMDLGPERKPSKLQKHPPIYTSPKSSPTEARAPQQMQGPPTTTAPPAPTGPAPLPPTMRQVEQQETSVREQPALSVQTQSQPSANTPGRFPSLQEKRSIFSPITTALKSSPAPIEEAEPTVKPVYSKRAKERFALDASDSEDESTPTSRPELQPHRSVSPLNETPPSHKRNDSGMQISPIEPNAQDQGPFGDHHESNLAVDTSGKSMGEKATTPSHATEITPIESEHTASTSKPSPSTITTHTPSTSRSTPTWSDSSLRTYMENDQDIKDLLIIVHDKSNVTPVAADHPLMVNLFSHERTKLAEMQSQLDSMLMGWMSRKNSSLLSR